MKLLLDEIKKCTQCEPDLALGAKPILTADKKSRIIIVGQAPGIKVHQSGIPWDDMSGKKLREWMAITNKEFYDIELISIIPMGFCYPGKGKSGDLPPRTECAPLWHNRLLQKMNNVKLTLLVGQYAQNYYLKDKAKRNLTETVRHFEEYLPDFFPLPHPSPRNGIWLRKNMWFEETVVPELQKRVKSIIF